NPKDSTKWDCEGCNKIADEYKLKGIYSLDAGDVYERQNAKAILLIHK
ncbi:MAG: hypothetical protein ACD_32C00136G0003, partial [uncultured bacterium]